MYNRPEEIKLRLVGSHSLWAHYLWNSGIELANYIDKNPDTVRAKKVLELGAGAGLPSIVSAFDGAKFVVSTDYPDPALIDNLEHNVKQYAEIASKISAVGYLWGSNIKEVMSNAGFKDNEVFDILLLSDLVFNHTEHSKLIKSCKMAIEGNPNAVVYVFFTHHRPHLAKKDMIFFDIAQSEGFQIEKILEEKRTPMFEEDPGAPEIRATVHGYKMTIPIPV